MTSLETLAVQISDIDYQIEQLTEQRDQLTEAVLTLVEPGEKKQAGDLTVTVRRPARRLNTRKIEARFPAAEYPTMYQQKNVLLSEEVKRQVSEAFLEEHGLYTVGRPSVSIK